LKRLLADPVYKGIRRANYAKSLGDKKHWVLKPEEEWVYFNVEPLVSEEDWDLANKAFAENERRHGKKRVPKTSSYLFSGLLKCSKCGEKMYVMPYPYMKTPRYVCRNCRDAKINEDVLITHFVEALKKIAISPDQLGPEKDLEQEIKDKQELIEVLKKEQKEIGRKVDKLVELYEDTAIDREGFRERYAALKERKDNLIVQIPRLQAEIDFIKTNEIARSYIIERATTLAALWVDLSYEAQRDIVRELAEQIDVGDDSLNFVLYHIPSSFDVVEKGVHNNRGSLPPPA
jgi:site-specific DNA recombinase